jgi:glutamyl-tRNA synthetase
LNKIRVRFAPSPTGFVHVGGLRTALYNYLFAKKNNGTFILRIEDTDRSRFVEGATENLIAVLNWAGLSPDEGPTQSGDVGPYFQSQRTEIYAKYAQQLIESGHAYYAFDTAEEIEQLRSRAKEFNGQPPKYDATTRLAMRNSLSLPPDEVAHLLAEKTPYVIRLKIPQDHVFSFHDVIRGQVTFHSSQVDDQVLIKSDGHPTYHLAHLVDDHLMEISHVIRGEEWLSSVPKHLFLYECFGWQPPIMAHLPLIFNPDGSKMSKRDIQTLGAMPSGKVNPDVQFYIKAGYEKEAIINHIALLGWSAGDDREVFTLKELEQNFSLERVNKSAAIFDIAKLNHLNQQHLSRKELAVLVSEIRPEIAGAGIDAGSDEYFTRVVELLQSRLHFRKEFIEMSRYFFEEPASYDLDVMQKRWKEDSPKLVLEFIDEIVKLDRFDKEAIEAALHKTVERNGVGNGRLIHPVRLAVSGIGSGPGLFDLLEVLGKERVVQRLKKAVEVIPLLRQ